MIYLKDNLIFLKELKNISCRKLSKVSGVSRPTIQNINKLENFSNVSLGTVMKLAKYFDVTLDDFIYKDLSSGFENKK